MFCFFSLNLNYSGIYLVILVHLIRFSLFLYNFQSLLCPCQSNHLLTLYFCQFLSGPCRLKYTTFNTFPMNNLTSQAHLSPPHMHIHVHIHTHTNTGIPWKHRDAITVYVYGTLYFLLTDSPSCVPFLIKITKSVCRQENHGFFILFLERQNH